MLLGTLGAILLGNILTGRRINRAGYGNKKGGKNNKMDFKCRLILQLILKYKNIFKMGLDLMVFILEIIYAK